jgi:hypothetical protein
VVGKAKKGIMIRRGKLLKQKEKKKSSGFCFLAALFSFFWVFFMGGINV